MIEREAHQDRVERESPRALTPEVVAARIALRVAELRLLAAWTSVLAGRVWPTTLCAGSLGDHLANPRENE
jgi:hypothetical protein